MPSPTHGAVRFLRICLLVALVLASAAPTPPALAQPGARPAVSIALVVDGTGVDSQVLPPLIREELQQVLQSDFQVKILPLERYRGDETLAGVTAVLGQALADPDLDLVVCTGVLGTMVAARRGSYPTPVIGAAALDAGIQDLPLTDRGTSGTPGFTYVMDANLLTQDVRALLEVAGPMERVALLGSRPMFLALPGIADGAEYPLLPGVRAVIVDGGLHAASALAGLPADVGGVALIGLAGFTVAGIDSLLDGLVDRRLPSVAVAGEPLVERGALVGTTSMSFMQRLARRVALNARKILVGEAAGELPVLLAREGSLFINMETAKRLGVYPPFRVTVDARLLGTDRDTGRPLDLWQAMDEAMATNQDLAAAAARLQADREELAIARARLLPQIELSAAGTILDEDRAGLPGRPAERTLTAGASATQVLFSDDAWAGYTVEKRLVEQAEARYEQDRLDVALGAASAYFQVLRAQTRERLQQANLRLSRENLERARVRVRLGEANRAEEFRWQAKIAQEKADLIAAIAERNVAEIELNRVLNRPLEEAFVLSEPGLDGQLSLLLDPRLESYLGDAWHLQRLREFAAEYSREVAPELVQLRAGIAAQQRVLSNTQRSFFVPDLVLSASWQHYLDEGGSGAGAAAAAGLDDDDWTASLALSLPLFQGGQRFAETRQAGKDLVGLRAQLAAASERTEQRVRNAVHRTSASRAAIALSREAAEASRRNLDLVSDAYSRGAVDLITLLDAQNALLSAELAAADAVYGFLLDLMELERAVGRFTYFASDAARDEWLEGLESWFDAQDEQER